tara:strand:- start:38 stop:490 length:453 start_codon:yes stop_codon:yes gene_type:complete
MARDIHQWVSSYGESHQNPTNKKIHWICVPLIMFTLLGLLSLVKFYSINLAYGLIIFALFFYLRLSTLISIGMFLISAIQLSLIYYLEQILLVPMLLYIYIGIFIVAWIGQFIGHKIEGKKPSFFEDLQFLLIGPAWLLSFIYKKSGIKY